MSFSSNKLVSSVKSLLLTNGSTKQTLVKNTFWLGLIEAFSKIIMFGVTIAIVRYLGPAQFGAYNLAYAYVAVFMILSDFGLSTITTRDLAKNKEKSQQYLSNLLGLKLVLSGLITFLILLSFPFVHNQASKEMIIAVMLFNLAQAFGLIFTSIFQAWEKMELIFVTRIAHYLAILIATIVVITLHGNGLGLTMAYFVGTSISIALAAFFMAKSGIHLHVTFDRTFVKELLIETLPLLGLTAVITLYANADTLLIGRFLGNEQAGLYQSAYKVLFAFQSINVINNVLFPRISVLIHEQKWATFRRLTKIVLGFSVLGLMPLAIVITIYQIPIMKLIYGATYISAAPAMVLLVWSGVINYFRNFTSNILFAKGKQKQVFWAVSAGFLINLIMNIIVLPQLGFVYAGWAMLVGEAVILIATMFYLAE